MGKFRDYYYIYKSSRLLKAYIKLYLRQTKYPNRYLFSGELKKVIVDSKSFDKLIKPPKSKDDVTVIYLSNLNIMFQARLHRTFVYKDDPRNVRYLELDDA